MTLALSDQLGEWNPQLFRELKGRLKPRNISIAVVISLLGQLLLLIGFSSQLPVVPLMSEGDTSISNRYCTGDRPYSDFDSLCVRVAGDSFDINWHLWCQDVFVWLSLVGMFALLGIGTYMLVNDLSKEDRCGTLNFLRLTPQSSLSILMGKLLGVPGLLYLAGFLALPLHLAVGLSGQVSLNLILGFYAIVGASCLFFYSVALLFGLVGKGLGNVRAWLAGSAVLIFLSLITRLIYNRAAIANQSPSDWMTLFAPSTVLPYLVEPNSLAASASSQAYSLTNLQWFYLPVGASVWSAIGLMLLNYGFWTYWVLQGLVRCFHHPSAALLSKQQSYWLTACFESVMLGFALSPQVRDGNPYPKDLFDNFGMLLACNLLLFLGLIAIVSPRRQAMLDWVGYRHQKHSSNKRGILSDLLWGEKSPALVAVALNLAIASAILLPWILLWTDSEYKTPALWGLLLSVSLILVCATIAQLMLFMKTPKRVFGATLSVGLAIVSPPIIFGLLSINPSENPNLWLFSALAWLAVKYTTGTAVFLAMLGQSLVLGLLLLQLRRQLQEASKSSTKALLS